MKRIKAEQVMACPGRLIDVRGMDEFAGQRLTRAECVPLDRLAAMASGWDRDECLILMCRSGVRSAQAVETLERMGFTNLAMLEGGIEACKKAGVEVIREARRIPIYRQVMIGAGILLLIGLVLARQVDPWFILIDWFVALGLLMGGATGYCPMARLLEKLPWNRACCTGRTPCDQGA